MRIAKGKKKGSCMFSEVLKENLKYNTVVFYLKNHCKWEKNEAT